MSRTAQKKNHNLDRLVGTVRKVEAVQRMLKELLEEHPVTIVATESYKAAYEECREKVRKIKEECRRENRRFRDHTFDLGQDEANCIYSAKLSKYSTWHQELHDANYSVKKIHQIMDNPQFFTDSLLQYAPRGSKRRGCGGDCCKPRSHIKADIKADITGDAPMQSPRTGTCYFMAALATVLNVPELLKGICVEHDSEVGVYGFVFFRDGAWLSTVVDDQLVVIREHSKYELFFGRSTNPNETWVPLIEKAFAKVHYDYESLDGGIAGEAVEDLTGGVTTQILTGDILDYEKFWSETMMEVNKSVLIVANRNNPSQHLHEGETGLEVNHSYSVLKAVEEEVDGRKERLVLLRNPWGHGEWKGKWSDGDAAWTPKWMEILGHKFLNDGKFWMSYSDFLTHWDELDRTMLFTDEWSMACRWIRYDLKEGKGMFRLHIKKKADTIIALQQPDDRYLASLQPRLRLVLSFYVYKEGDTEDNYLHRVRSTIKYARRSINAKLEGLEPGIYNIVPDVKREDHLDEDRPNGVFTGEQQDFVNHKRSEVIDMLSVPDKKHSRRKETHYNHNVPLWEKQLGQMSDIKMDSILGLRVYSKDKNFEIYENSENEEAAVAKHHNNPEDNQRVKPPIRTDIEAFGDHRNTFLDQCLDSPTEVSGETHWNRRAVDGHANADTNSVHASRNNSHVSLAHQSDTPKKGITAALDGNSHSPNHPHHSKLAVSHVDFVGHSQGDLKTTDENSSTTLNLDISSHSPSGIPSDEANVAIEMEPTQSSSMTNWITVSKAVSKAAVQSAASENEKTGNKASHQDDLDEKSTKQKPSLMPLPAGKAELSTSRSRETPRREPAENFRELSSDGPAKAARTADDKGGHGSTTLAGKAKTADRVSKDRK